jgi:hypothetical protein
MAFLQIACGSSQKNQEDAPPVTQETLTVPVYAPTMNSPFSVTLKDEIAYVIARQTRGTNFAKKLAEQGRITLDDGQTVQLLNYSKNACPSDLPNCNEKNSAALGIAQGALVADLDELIAGTQNQGARGTCMSFSINGAADILLKRKGLSVDLGEQLTYLRGKELTGTWTSPGLPPMKTLQAFVENRTKLSPESLWPYNPETTCSAYRTEHPGSVCSETEAQGNGAEGKLADPNTDQGPHYRLKTVHQLYASLGRTKQALYQGYPVILSVNANSDFSIADSPSKLGVVSWIFKESSCGESVCGHAITAVGYQDDPSIEGGGFLIIRNSWGQDWGVDGLAYLTYAWLEQSLLDAQAIVEVESID